MKSILKQMAVLLGIALSFFHAGSVTTANATANASPFQNEDYYISLKNGWGKPGASAPQFVDCKAPISLTYKVKTIQPQDAGDLKNWTHVDTFDGVGGLSRVNYYMGVLKMPVGTTSFNIFSEWMQLAALKISADLGPVTDESPFAKATALFNQMFAAEKHSQPIEWKPFLIHFCVPQQKKTSRPGILKLAGSAGVRQTELAHMITSARNGMSVIAPDFKNSIKLAKTKDLAEWLAAGGVGATASALKHQLIEPFVFRGVHAGMVLKLLQNMPFVDGDNTIVDTSSQGGVHFLSMMQNEMRATFEANFTDPKAAILRDFPVSITGQDFKNSSFWKMKLHFISGTKDGFTPLADAKTFINEQKPTGYDMSRVRFYEHQGGHDAEAFPISLPGHCQQKTFITQAENCTGLWARMTGDLLAVKENLSRLDATADHGEIMNACDLLGDIKLEILRSGMESMRRNLIRYREDVNLPSPTDQIKAFEASVRAAQKKNDWAIDDPLPAGDYKFPFSQAGTFIKSFPQGAWFGSNDVAQPGQLRDLSVALQVAAVN